MARGKVVGGGDYLDWKEIGEGGALLMVRKRGQLADRDLGNGMTAIILCDVYVVKGRHAGRTVFGDEAAGRGITNELIRHPDGTDLPCKVEIKERAGRPYAAITAATDAEVAEIDAVFPVGQEDATWERLRSEQQGKTAVGAGAPAGGSGSGGSEDTPPW